MKDLAIASLILGIIGALLSAIFIWYGLILAILGVVFGIFPFIKGVLRPIAAAGLVFSLLGILIFAAFFIRFMIYR